MLSGVLRPVSRLSTRSFSTVPAGWKKLYTGTVNTVGGRDGATAKSSDGRLTVKLDKPTDMGGKAEHTNPEQLFAAGYSVCFNGAMGAVAAKEGKKLPTDTSVTGIVTLGLQEKERNFGLFVELQVKIPGWSREDAQALVDKAHTVCPYSRAIKGNVPVQLTVL